MFTVYRMQFHWLGLQGNFNRIAGKLDLKNLGFFRFHVSSNVKPYWFEVHKRAKKKGDS